MSFIADGIRTRTRVDPEGKSGGYKFEVLPGARDTKHKDAVGELHELARKHVGNITITVKNRGQMAAHAAKLKARAQSVAAILKGSVKDAVNHSFGTCAMNIVDPRNPGKDILLLVLVDGSHAYIGLAHDLVHRAHLIVDRNPGGKIYKDRTGLLAIAP